MFIPPKEGKPGEELTWRWLNKIWAWCRMNTINLGPGSGLSMVQMDCGTFLRVSESGNGAQLAVTDGTITARSGTTLGSGNVFTAEINGTTATVGTVDLAVVNFSSTTGGIPTGTYVWIEQDPGGTWVITAVDCGN